MINQLLTPQRLEAITNNDKRANGQFYYGVTSTKIFCQPSCPSRLPKVENILIFFTAQEALESGFRPCKRCKPLNKEVPDNEWSAQIKDYLDAHYTQPLTLDKIAEECHGSPFHLQRIFKKIYGCSPLDYLTKLRIEQAKLLLETTTISCALVGKHVGFANPTYFTTLFKQQTGQTPLAYRRAALVATQKKRM